MHFLQHLQDNIHYFLTTSNYEATNDAVQLRQQLTSVINGLAPLYQHRPITAYEDWMLWQGPHTSKIAFLIEPDLKDLNSDTSLLFKRLQVSFVIILAQNIHQYSEVPLLRHHPFAMICVHPEKVGI